MTLVRDRLARRFRLERLILFGSRARGEALRESDHDFLAVSPDFAALSWPDRLAEASRAISPRGEPPLGAPVEILCYTPEEFARKSREISIVALASREGVDILAEARGA